MIEFDVPGRGSYRLEHLVLDLNGTIALDGEIIEGVAERLCKLGDLIEVSVVTADTCGSAGRLEGELNVVIRRIGPGVEAMQKAALVQQLGAETTVAIGNGCNDVSMLEESALGICVLGGEGAAREALASADVVVPGINDALDLLLNPNRLVATLRR